MLSLSHAEDSNTALSFMYRSKHGIQWLGSLLAGDDETKIEVVVSELLEIAVEGLVSDLE